jgi:hypothetical protein
MARKAPTVFNSNVGGKFKGRLVTRPVLVPSFY